MSKALESELLEKFKSKMVITREELFDFYIQHEPDLKENTFAWRIYNLQKRNILKASGRGKYTITSKPNYMPNVSSLAFRIGKFLEERYNGVQYCIWETAWLNQFTQHQLGKSFLIVEIERGFEETIFFDLKKSFKNMVYMNPDERAIDLYLVEAESPIIIKFLSSRSPITNFKAKHGKLKIPKLEKILVDLFADKRIYAFVQGAELKHIYENVLSNYTLNFTTIFSYAARRNQEQIIREFLKVNFPNQQNFRLND